MEPRLVSIVIPTYNCGRLIARALHSVVDQTYADWEVLVIDNHSADNTRDVVLGFGDDRIRYLTISNEGIIARSRNLGVRESRGRWIAFLDADDWWTPDKLVKSVQALEQGFDFVYHDLFRAGPGKGPFPWRKVRTRKLTSPVFEDLLLRGNAIANSSVVVDKALFIEAGGLSEAPELVAVEDFDAWLRVSRISEKFMRLPGTYGYYWIGNGNTSSPQRTITGLLSIEYKYGAGSESSTVGKMPAWMALALARAYYQLGKYAEARKCISSVRYMKHLDRFDLGIIARILFFKVLSIIVNAKEQK
jgi:glycosyltransferase involved in cell wall biosynthesis